MLQFEIVLLSLPVVTAPAANQILPPFVPDVTAIVAEPRIEAFVMVLLVASAMNLIVGVPDVALVLALEMVRVLPLEFKPSTVTLSAPLKVKSASPATLPPMVRAAPPAGAIAIDE